jgi:predicted AAA+ superfamily ATPase
VTAEISCLFDEIRAVVDVKKWPGQYFLLGSTEFSHEVLVKESLTGRPSRLRIFTMNLAEAYELKPNSNSHTHCLYSVPRASKDQLIKFVIKGGFPGFFAVRSEEEHDMQGCISGSK